MTESKFNGKWVTYDSIIVTACIITAFSLISIMYIVGSWRFYDGDVNYIGVYILYILSLFLVVSCSVILKNFDGKRAILRFCLDELDWGKIPAVFELIQKSNYDMIFGENPDLTQFRDENWFQLKMYFKHKKYPWRDVTKKAVFNIATGEHLFRK